jgi:Zn-dependent M28 family amino/carboxypeptidase
VQAGDGAAAPNVVGILPGADPSLRGEFVLLVAHMDHLGVGAPVGGDSIMNGADDNASGTAGVLELARAFGGLGERPRRSLVFLLVSGEEEGLWGSIYYVTHPAVPLDRTVAAINLDMIGRNAPDWVYVLGAELSSLGTTIQRVADLHPELDLRPVAVAQPLRGSDHVPFAYGGVPVAFFHSGLHPEYHTPLDEDSLVDGDKAARIARLAFYVALDVAGQSSRPAWNPGARPGPARRSAR